MDTWVPLYRNISALSTVLSTDECSVCAVIVCMFGMSIVLTWCSVTVVCWENIHLNSRCNMRRYSHAAAEIAGTIINSALMWKSTLHHHITLSSSGFGHDLKFNRIKACVISNDINLITIVTSKYHPDHNCHQ